MAKWSKDIKKINKRIERNLTSIVRQYVFFLYSNIAKRTPVRTGRARANWNVSKGTVDHSVTDDTSKSVSLEDVPKGLGADYYISNNVSYIGRLEYGHSQQAPNGMVGVTVAETGRIFNSAVEAVRSEK